MAINADDSFFDLAMDEAVENIEILSRYEAVLTYYDGSTATIVRKGDDGWRFAGAGPDVTRSGSVLTGRE